MKFLMFGWGLPPHISEELGTACHGLAHALVKSGVKLLFVVSKLSVQELSAGVEMINEGAIFFRGGRLRHRPHHKKILRSGDTQKKQRNILNRMCLALQDRQPFTFGKTLRQVIIYINMSTKGFSIGNVHFYSSTYVSYESFAQLMKCAGVKLTLVKTIGDENKSTRARSGGTKDAKLRSLLG